MSDMNSYDPKLSFEELGKTISKSWQLLLLDILAGLYISIGGLGAAIAAKILCCIVPVMAFVAIGFEHCIANMFLIPIGLLVDGAPLSVHLSNWTNILPVTIGNIFGGVLIMFIHPNRIRQIKNLFT